jgi:hypothetical protein
MDLLRTIGLTGLLLMAPCHPSRTQETKGQIVLDRMDCFNYIHISGESNINQFSFSFNRTDLFNKNEAEVSDTGNINISIPIRDFQASNPMMYHDFLAMMKESEFPRITICFSGKQLNLNRFSPYSLLPDIRITIAGITRIYKVNCSVLPCAGNFFIQGEKKIRLTDFRIKPPVKLKGLVKVNDEINVNFGFIIIFTDANPLSLKL